MARTRVRALFLGSKALGLNVFVCLADAYPGVSWTIIHPDDAGDPRSCIAEFCAMADAKGVAFHVVRGQAEACALVAKLAPEIGFVCGWYWLFSAADIDAFPKGLWGIHNSLLPKFRGGAPLVWTILSGEREVGSTVFRISAGMDDGDVLLQVRIELAPHEDVADALRRINQGLLKRLGDKWSALLEGRAVLSPQDESQATWCGQRSDEDGGIDWSRPAQALHDFIRAQAPPYPGAWSWLAGKRLRVTKARPFSGVFFGTPGQVLRRMGDTVLVSCGANTALELLAVSVEGVADPQAPSAIIRSVKDRLALSPFPAA